MLNVDNKKTRDDIGKAIGAKSFWIACRHTANEPDCYSLTINPPCRTDQYRKPKPPTLQSGPNHRLMIPKKFGLKLTINIANNNLNNTKTT
jgi:hypothetical protein